MRYIGCSGWYYDDWKERFYPEKLPKKDWLGFYARRFNTVEVNATFYRFPTEKLMKGWHEKELPKGFKFTLKGNKTITHIKKLKEARELVDKFYKLSNILKERLGAILWQFPPSLKIDLERLERFCKDLDPGFENVIEFRHKTWFVPEAYKILKKNKISYCIVSAPKLPETAIVTSKIAYVRFHGKNSWYDYEYSKKEMKSWAKVISKLKAKKTYIYFNNDYNAYAVKNALQLKNELEKIE
ncbi:DUF72 domain-containing protein [Candidatus Woesearchaeota archaeon]|nr:MAG: DUF72 domain-containing protein [Candidatus Woesearchaeota archaeon]